MGSVNISIKDEAYRFLKSLKRKDQSFSEVILGFREKKGDKENLMRFFGALKNKEIAWKEREKRMKEFREEFGKRTEETANYMEKARKEK